MHEHSSKKGFLPGGALDDMFDCSRFMSCHFQLRRWAAASELIKRNKSQFDEH